MSGQGESRRPKSSKINGKNQRSGGLFSNFQRVRSKIPIGGALGLASAVGVVSTGAFSAVYLRTTSYDSKTTNIPVREQRCAFQSGL